MSTRFRSAWRKVQVIAFCLAAAWSAPAQVDTNRLATRGLTNFWAALSGTRAVRVGAFGNSVVDFTSGGKLDGVLPNVRALLGAESGGITSNYPYLYFVTNGLAEYVGPDAHWWTLHLHLTNGLVTTYLAAIPNGPENQAASVWCDTVAVYYLTDPASGSFTISLSTNGGPFGWVCSVDAQGPAAGAVTNLALPLGYYQMQVACTNGTVVVIDSGMWNEHQRNLAVLMIEGSGRHYDDWTAVSTNITWPIFQAWSPDLLLLEDKASADSFQQSFPAVEQMFTNCAPHLDALYLGTTALGTNVVSTNGVSNNQLFTLPQNAAMRQLALRYGRDYWNGYSIITYEQATLLGWTQGDGVHFNHAGGTALGQMLWSDLWQAFHYLDFTSEGGSATLSWYALAGQTFQLQSRDQLATGAWQNLGGPITASNPFVSVSSALAPASQGFYRLVQP